MPERDVLYVRDLAARLGRTEAAIRAAIRRRSPSVPHEHVFPLGAELAIAVEDYEAWLEAKRRAGKKEAR